MCDSGAWCREKALVKLYGRADNCDVPLSPPRHVEVPRCGHGSSSAPRSPASLSAHWTVSGRSRSRSESKEREEEGRRFRRGQDRHQQDAAVGRQGDGAGRQASPSSTRFRRAQAINKAAAEKAERDKAANAAREAKEKEAAAKAGPTTQKRGGEVALPTLPDEGDRAAKRQAHRGLAEARDGRGRRAAAHAEAGGRQVHRQAAEGRVGDARRSGPRPPTTRRWSTCSRRRSRASPAARRARRTASTTCCSDADKAAPMPETKVKHETPEWAKPEIRESAPAPAPIAVQKPVKRDDGIIRVVQGAAGSTPSGSARPAVATTTTTRTPAPPPGAGVRKQTAAVNSKPGEWADPFSDPSPRNKGGKQVAAKRVVEDDEDMRPAPRKNTAAAPASAKRASGDWDDPFETGGRPQGDRHPPRGPSGRAEQAGEGARASRRRRQVGRPVHVRRSAGQVKAGGASGRCDARAGGQARIEEVRGDADGHAQGGGRRGTRRQDPGAGPLGHRPEEAPLGTSPSHRFRRRAAECGFFYVRRLEVGRSPGQPGPHDQFRS